MTVEEPPVAAATEPPPPIEGWEPLQRLDPRVIRTDRIGGWIATACVSGPLFLAAPIVWLSGGRPLAVILVWTAWLVLTVVLCCLAHFWPAIDYRHTFYRTAPHALEIRRGVVWRTVITVPRSRVQHIDVSQGPLERSNGLASLTIYTAGTEHAMVGLKGLAHEHAVAIRDRFLPGEEDDGV